VGLTCSSRIGIIDHGDFWIDEQSSCGKGADLVLYQASNELRRLVVDTYAKGESSSLLFVFTIASGR
jgi:hypothetical protein